MQTGKVGKEANKPQNTNGLKDEVLATQEVML
jgi:hypothetical protein